MNSLLLHLREESACVQEFISVLGLEQQAMLDGRFSDLHGLTEQKAQLLDRMAALDHRRVAVQVAMGFEPSRDGANAAAAAGGAETQKLWTALLALAQDARADNHRNGALVHGQLDFTQKALHFLQSSAQLFYGPDGARRTTSGAGTRLALG